MSLEKNIEKNIYSSLFKIKVFVRVTFFPNKVKLFYKHFDLCVVYLFGCYWKHCQGKRIFGEVYACMFFENWKSNITSDSFYGLVVGILCKINNLVRWKYGTVLHV